MMTALQAPDEALDVHEKNFIAKIREHGWFGTNVLAEEDLPCFTYTTGFWLTLGVPEIIVFGLQSKTAHDIFWEIFRDLKAGDTLPHLTPNGDLLGNHDAYLFPVQKEQYAEHLGWGRWFYAGNDFPCSQLVWPDREGRFPWDTDFDPEVVGSQIDIAEGGWATREA
jgi:hypothetical protein